MRSICQPSIGRPRIGRSTLPGSRVEDMRAWRIARIMRRFLWKSPADGVEDGRIRDRTGLPVKFRKVRHRSCDDFRELIVAGDSDNRDVDLLLSQREAECGLDRGEPFLPDARLDCSKRG